MKRIVFTVTNELNHDQRMIRICNSLAKAGYDVTLTGVKRVANPAIKKQSFKQKKIRVYSKKGFAFYAEYNVRLFFYLIFKRCDVICSIDLDTIIAGYFCCLIRGKTRIYDAHEYFSQLKEVVSRPWVYRFWHSVESRLLPRYSFGYTVSESIAMAFKENYGVDYEVIRNVPVLNPLDRFPEQERRIVLYQGSVNEARGFEVLIPAMKSIPAVLHIYGKGNFLEQAKKMVDGLALQEKILFKGEVAPEELPRITANAAVGINLVEATGLNQTYSLANKCFDYIHAALPQITMNFPEYRRINEQYNVAILLDELSVSAVSNSINLLLKNIELYKRLQENCIAARGVFNWQNEEKKLLAFYKHVLKK